MPDLIAREKRHAFTAAVEESPWPVSTVSRKRAPAPPLSQRAAQAHLSPGLPNGGGGSATTTDKVPPTVHCRRHLATSHCHFPPHCPIDLTNRPVSFSVLTSHLGSSLCDSHKLVAGATNSCRRSFMEFRAEPGSRLTPRTHVPLVSETHVRSALKHWASMCLDHADRHYLISTACAHLIFRPTMNLRRQKPTVARDRKPRTPTPMKIGRPVVAT
jgi:hypothetical protein